ncbi:DNA adenine methylase [Thermosulfurimonas sp. F29]|uniref:DNA adenine methylase n=1 Tax=Thermosulfurimonas sp. F29 TaxID=2867247 RepID=UPI001C82BECA|nr:DNA adenine methylase [Thermosulfurimonas sp. F29]MBX6423322.1 DNA adenine methylase [Thermosulfurimonas sp. F29]
MSGKRNERFNPPVSSSATRIMAFRWYGGKFSHVDWIVPLLPPAFHYCEPFGGSAAILLNKEPSPVETYNDIDGDLVNFFRTLRDKPEELIRKLYWTPFSREEFLKAWEARGRTDLDDVERARLFFVRAEQVRLGLAQRATPGRWAWCKLTSRRGMSGAVSRWISRIEALWLVAERLRTVQIEHDDALEVIKRYDSPDTLFYLDPPYVHEARSDPNAYGNEMDAADHERLARLLRQTRGKVALSGYNSPLMEDLYGDWPRVEAPERTIQSSKGKRREVLWVNYALEEIPNCGQVVDRLRAKGFVFRSF